MICKSHSELQLAGRGWQTPFQSQIFDSMQITCTLWEVTFDSLALPLSDARLISGEYLGDVSHSCFGNERRRRITTCVTVYLHRYEGGIHKLGYFYMLTVTSSVIQSKAYGDIIDMLVDTSFMNSLALSKL